MGKKFADQLVNEPADPWFENIGESSTSLLLKLYSQVRLNLVLYMKNMLLILRIDLFIGLQTISDAHFASIAYGSFLDRGSH